LFFFVPPYSCQRSHRDVVRHVAEVHPAEVLPEAAGV
jgi:hypothetical protein